MLSNAGLSKEFWAEAVNTACFLVNRSPSTAIECKTPEEVWSGKDADYGRLRVFGCAAYAHVNEGKLAPRAKKCIFLGYEPGVKGYRLWNPEAHGKKFLISRDVTFDESNMISKKPQEDRGGVGSEHPRPNYQDEGSTSEKVEFELTEPLNLQEEVQEQLDNNVQEEAETDQTQLGGYNLVRDREPRLRKPNPRYGLAQSVESELTGYALSVAIDIEGDDEPNSFTEAINSAESEDWLLAMSEEMESLHKNDTWVIVDKPKDQKIVGSKWVFKRKEGSQGMEKPRFKARLVAKGFTQREGIDYNEVFSPVVKHSSIRILLAMVALYDLHLEQLDVKTAFLHGELEERIFMQQPEGFEVTGEENRVCLLKKSLYGLKQSPRQWYKRFDTFMTGNGYNRSLYDCCVYFKVLPNGSYVYLLLYVDDMLIAAKDMSDIDRLKFQLSGEFEMKDLGHAKRILGMEIHRDREAGKLYLSQKTYIEKVSKRFGMLAAKPVSTPLAAHFKLSSALCPQTDDEVEYMSRTPYSSAVGSLMYAMVCTRPDIAQAVSVVSRYMANPGKTHWQAVKWVLRYLKGSAGVGLVFDRSREGAGEVIGFVDSDYAGDLDKRRSLTGYVFTLCGGAISWKATLQPTVALSTTEAEYMAAAVAMKEATWLKGLVADLGLKQDVLSLFCDSQSAIHLSKNQMYHERTKHIDIRLHYIREVVASGVISLVKIGTAENAADMLTKSVTLSKFKHCLDLLNLSA